MIFPFHELAQPEPLGTAEWTETYRVLTRRGGSAEPGPMRLDRTPYMRGIMQRFDAPTTRECWIMKCVQCGLSECSRSCLGRMLDVDPGPGMIVFPDEQAAQETIADKVLPMIQDTPRLARYLTGRAHDITRRQLRLAHTDIFIGWSRSPQSLASRPIKFLVLDEVDKFGAYRGVEADPTSLAIARTTTYGHRRKVFGLSTPTIPTGNIAQRYEGAGCRYTYRATCQGCGEGMAPDFERVDWPGRDEEDPAALRDQVAAIESRALVPEYVCPTCEFRHDEVAYRRAVRQGDWVGDGPEGAEVIAFHVHGLLSPWLGVRVLALEWAKCKLAGIAAMQHFYNSLLGVPFWDESVHGDSEMSVGAGTVWRKARHAYPRGLVPDWAHVLVAGVDSKRQGHYYVIRAYGDGFRSRLVDYGETEDSEQLRAVLARAWSREGGGATMKIRRACVDVGGGRGVHNRSRTDELYRFCKTDPAHLFAIQGYGGAGAPAQPVTTRSHQYHPPGENRASYDVTLSTLDTEYFKDVVSGRINSDLDDLWEIFGEVGQDYVMQVASEKKILVKTEIRLGERKDIWRWQPRATKAANHYWDCEVYAAAAAYMLDMDRVSNAANAQPRRYKQREGGTNWRIGR